MLPALRTYPDELRERAARLYRECDLRSMIRRLAEQLNAPPEVLRTWIRQDQADRGDRNDRPHGGHQPTCEGTVPPHQPERHRRTRSTSGYLTPYRSETHPDHLPTASIFCSIGGTSGLVAWAYNTAKIKENRPSFQAAPGQLQPWSVRPPSESRFAADDRRGKSGGSWTTLSPARLGAIRMYTASEFSMCTNEGMPNPRGASERGDFAACPRGLTCWRASPRRI